MRACPQSVRGVLLLKDLSATEVFTFKWTVTSLDNQTNTSNPATTGTLEGIYAMLIYSIIYIVMTLNAWTFILSTELESKGRGTYFTDLGYLSRINPLLAITFTMTLLSMAGVPPLAGFCAKMYVFFAAMEGSMYFLAVLGFYCQNYSQIASGAPF